MAYMSDIGLKGAYQGIKCVVYKLVAVAVFSPGHIYNGHSKTGAEFVHPESEIQCVRIFFPCKNVHFVRLGKLIADALAIDFRARIVKWRVTVDDFENSHESRFGFFWIFLNALLFL